MHFLTFSIEKPKEPNLNFEFQGNRPSSSGEDFLSFFTIYGHGGHPGHDVIKLFSCSTQLSMKFQMLIVIKISRYSAIFRLR